MAGTTVSNSAAILERRVEHCPLCGSQTADFHETRLSIADVEITGVVVRRAGKLIKLSPREFWLLVYLVRNKDKLVTRTMIERHAWNFDESYVHLTNQVDVYINYLRNKIDKGFSEKLIHTIRGYGFMMGSADNAERIMNA